ncbi:SGNH/GDSL hydrolase family protein [Planctomycetaceae bacterium]|nr:SGNH/GDSL hydrolase family protein [Planctomycetaceae bacterium]MDC0261744.1 SGNH/GDSL hydrolase family protein [Planctomycetaceae bacterium]MDC0307838.1 SGNH/GDSL hydrolase family protein [Planctomycetaceae bacterium]MDG2389512.1 SGNH/GDSL hydrolase family protein [Planctomycetaceae bacterium]
MTWFDLTTGYLIGTAIWSASLFVALIVLLKMRRGSDEIPIRKKLVNAAISLWLLCVLMTLLEVGFAVGYDRTDSFNMSNVSKKWFRKYAEPEEKVLRFGPNEGIVYRDVKPFPESIPENAKHICFLGDSFTYGHGINHSADRFSNLVGQNLEKDSGEETIVTNLGKPGTDLFWAESILRKLFEDDIRVDTAVYNLCLNDIESFHPDFQTFYSADWLSGSDFFLFRDTYFFNLLYFRVQQAQRPQVKNYYDFMSEYYAGDPWKRMKQKLVAIRELCEQNGCEFRLVIFPFLHNLGNDYAFASAHEQIVEFCRENNIPVEDLLPVMQEHSAEGLIVSRFDAHPNELANRYAADSIFEWLTKKKAMTEETDQ